MPAATPVRRKARTGSGRRSPGSGRGDAWRVGREHLGDDAAGRLVHRNLLGGAEEGVARQCGERLPELVRRGYVHLAGRPQFAVLGADVLGEVAKRPDEGCGGPLVIGVGELCADPPMITDVQVDAVVFAKPVARGVAGDAEFADVDDDLQGIEFRGTPWAEELVRVDVQAIDGLDLRARGPGQVEGVL